MNIAKRTVMFNLFIEGEGFVGKVKSIQPPAIKKVYEELPVPGGKIKVFKGVEPLEAKFVLYEDNVNAEKSLAKLHNDPVTLIFKQARSDGKGGAPTVVHTLSGQIDQLEQGEIDNEKGNDNTFTITCTYYKKEVEGSLIHEIDLINLKYVIGGQDLSAAFKGGIGA